MEEIFKKYILTKRLLSKSHFKNYILRAAKIEIVLTFTIILCHKAKCHISFAGYL